MENRDFWFEPGDKVMRVSYAGDLGLPIVSQIVHPDVKKGKVLCVERCWSDGMNRVLFVGVQSATPMGWYACCFRRLSEIQLIMQAVKRQGKGEKREVTEQETN